MEGLVDKTAGGRRRAMARVVAAEKSVVYAANSWALGFIRFPFWNEGDAKPYAEKLFGAVKRLRSARREARRWKA